MNECESGQNDGYFNIILHFRLYETVRFPKNVCQFDIKSFMAKLTSVINADGFTFHIWKLSSTGYLDAWKSPNSRE